MKTRVKIKIFIGSKTFKVILSIFSIMVLSAVMVIPSILTMRPKWSAISFSRDATSGTRQAFVEKVLLSDPKEFSPGANVREAKNNESMIKLVVNNRNSISYVSFGTVAHFNQNNEAALKENFNKKSINYATLGGVEPNRENLKNGSYPATRDFNIFLRVDKESEESELLNSTWDGKESEFTNPKSESLKKIDNNLKASYLFYSWAYLSNQADELLKIESEVSSTNPKIDFTPEIVNSYVDAVALDKDAKIMIEIVGSSSARKVLDLLSTDRDKSFGNIAENDWAFSKIEFIKATNGSGDAFRKTIAGTINPFIGLQSRAPGEIELSKWNWTKENGVSDKDETKKPYNNFAIDALLVIYNTKSLNDKVRRNIEIEIGDGKSPNTLNNLYSLNEFMGFNEIFKPHTYKGSSIDEV